MLEFCEFCAHGIEPFKGLVEEELLAGDAHIGSLKPEAHGLEELLK